MSNRYSVHVYSTNVDHDGRHVFGLTEQQAHAVFDMLLAHGGGVGHLHLLTMNAEDFPKATFVRTASRKRSTGNLEENDLS